MPSTHQQRNERRLEIRIFQGRCKQVAFEVVDADQCAVEAVSQRLAVHHSNQQRSDQPGSCRHSDAIQLLKTDAGFIERLLNYRADHLYVRPAGELGHDAAEDAMNILRKNGQ
jgi:hypothetical protein